MNSAATFFLRTVRERFQIKPVLCGIRVVVRKGDRLLHLSRTTLLNSTRLPQCQAQGGFDE